MANPFCASIGTPVCDAAVASIQAMDQFYQSLSADQRTGFTAQHDSVMANYNANKSFYTCYIPFGDFSALQAVGLAADQLLNQMEQAQGLAPTAGQSAANCFDPTMLYIGGALIIAFFFVKR